MDGKLTDDDGGAPLFNAPALHPGEQVSSCIEIKYSGTQDAPVKLAGRVRASWTSTWTSTSRGTVAAITIATGSPAPRSSLTGTLAEFLRTGDSAESAIPAWTASDGEPARTFRHLGRAARCPQAEGQTASVDFEWSAPGQEEPVKPSNPSDPSNPATPPVAGTAPKTKSPTVTGTSPGDSHTPHVSGSHDSGPAGSGGGPAARRRQESSSDSVKDIAVGAGKRVAFPSLLALLGFLFILLQNRLDRRDPKLAMAPLNKDSDLLPFGQLPWAGN